ncbi:factor of DNA methylation 5-like isoform X2 [Vigna unguiculata]|uniref:Factor of DNA methylation 1-5/IDN2 domain-containing protein n=2 Tax=Vigna unguiculata TaxID=3917 RepID=A0A4D6LAK4_VIGUN|nr:factor of DNA methylation 5-like isoform X2 [Vigna unguiculata]QCD85460.1 hypothetical protein DEO72_LG2g5820 [Vigna unguiculata]
MANNECEGSTTSKQRINFVNMKEVIDSQRQKIIDMEDTNVLKADCKRDLKESLKMALKMVKRETLMDKECQKELEQMKDMNSNMSGELKRMKKDNEMMAKELAESKALNDKLQEKLTEDNRRMTMKLVEENSRIIRKLTEENDRIMGKRKKSETLDEDEYKELKAKVAELEEELVNSKDLNQALIIKEREISDELEKARKKLMVEITEISCLYDNICVKRVGEIDTEPFIRTFRAKNNMSKEEAEHTALKMCSLWQKNVEDPHWYPFQIITIEGKSKEVLDEEDGRLKRLKVELGFRAYKAVVAALMEMNEYNSSGRFIVREIWNKEKGRRATLKEGIEFMINQIKSKRRKTQEMVDDEADENGDDDDPPIRKNEC